jgi:hypothetical protein
MAEESEPKQHAESAESKGAAPPDAASDAVPKKEKKNKGPPPGVVIKLKPKLSKKERREIQEQQRAAKQQQQNPSAKKTGGGGGNQSNTKSQQAKPTQSQAPKLMLPQVSGKVGNANTDAGDRIVFQDNSLSLFSHLPQYRGKWNESADSIFLLGNVASTHAALLLQLIVFPRHS